MLVQQGHFQQRPGCPPNNTYRVSCKQAGTVKAPHVSVYAHGAPLLSMPKISRRRWKPGGCSPST